MSANWKALIYFQLSKGPNFYKIPQEIWLTLTRFTGRQEKKDALTHIILGQAEQHATITNYINVFAFLTEDYNPII